MLATIATVSLLCVAQAGAPPVTRDTLAAYLRTTGRKAAIEAATRHIADTSAKLTAARRGVIDRRLTTTQHRGVAYDDGPTVYAFAFPSLAVKREFVLGLQLALKGYQEDLRSPKPVLPDLRADSMRVGHVGRLRAPTANEELARRIEIVSVIDATSALVTMPGQDNAEFLLHLDTTGKVDGSVFAVDYECHVVTGTATVLGRTVFVVEPLDLKPYLNPAD